jgi:hypothetical protein
MIKPSVYLKVYGERNTGTNFVTMLVRKNFAVTGLQDQNRVGEHFSRWGNGLAAEDYGKLCLKLMDMDCERVRHSDFGWKHGAPPEREIRSAEHSPHTLFICIAKHPLSWLRSLHARPYSPLERPPSNFHEFIRYQMPVSRRDNLGPLQRLGMVELWNAKNAAFARLPAIAGRCIVIAYEEILNNPQAFLSRISQYLLPMGSEFVWDLPSTKKDGLSFEEYRTKYDLSRSSQIVSAEDLEFINARLDRDVLRTFGYQTDDGAP